MSNKASGDTHFTQQVKSLIDKIYGISSAKDSVLARAIAYFDNQFYVQQRLIEFKGRLEQLNESLATSKGKEAKGIEQKIIRLDREQRDLQERLTFEREERYQHLLEICYQVIELCEANDFVETNRKSAQVLGSIQLLSPTEGKKVPEKNEQSKPLYRAVLCLRLLDALCIGKAIAEPYIKKYLGEITPDQFQYFCQTDPDGYQRFVDYVKVPVLMAAILQDIGNYHPDAQEILCGSDGQQSQFRVLEVEDRKKLLQINYRETFRYLVDGIGMPAYIGNSKVERELFIEREKEKLAFLKHLHKTSVNPKNGIGNLLKVPQIYVSIVLSTKASYNYKLLPKVYQALKQNAERGHCSQGVVNYLYRITGAFPQGYGITYIPDDAEGNATDRYEYAIVTQLYPENPEYPACRIATRQLTFISYGQDIVIENRSNLYFAETAKKLANISKKRLMEILELLASNYKEREKLDLIPRCWHANEFFSLKDNQKLWNKTVQ